MALAVAPAKVLVPAAPVLGLVVEAVSGLRARTPATLARRSVPSEEEA